VLVTEQVAAINDQCEGAISIDRLLLDDSTVIVGSNEFASNDMAQDNCETFSFSHGVWYSITASGIMPGSFLTATTCTEETTMDTAMSILVGDDCDELQCIGSNDDQGGDCGETSTVTWPAVVGETYYVLVQGFSTMTVGTFGLKISQTLSEAADRPRNDECRNAIGLELGTLTIGSTLNATTDDDACNSGDSTTRGVWYSVAGTGGRILASTCSNSTDFDAQISVVEGEDDSEDDDCSEGFVCKSRSVPDSSCEFGAQVASWISDVNRTYYLLLHSESLSVTGTFGLTVRPFVFPTNDAPTPAPLVPTTPGPTGSPVVLESPSARPSPNLSQSPMSSPTPPPITSRPTSIPTVNPTTKPPTGIVPGNDSLQNAIPIMANGSVMLGSTVGATDDKEAVGVDFCGAGIGAPGVWFMVTGTGTGVQVSTCSDATQYDTALSIFTMKADDTTLQCIGGGDNNQRCIFSRPKSSLVSFFAEAGVSYYVLVHGTNSEVGFFGLSAATFDRVANDVCEAAISISPNGESLVEGSTWSATIDLAPQVFHCGAWVGAKPGVWYRTVGTGASFTATTCSAATDFNTAVSVFGGVCGGFDNATMLRCLGGNDDDFMCAGQFGTSTFTWQTEPDEIYYILVHGGQLSDMQDIFLSAFGDFGLLLTAS
jgi:hypothetical protein